MLAYLLFIVVIIFTVRFVPIIAVRRPSRGNFIGILTNILFMAYHTSRYIDAIACAGQILVQWESFIFVIICEARGTMHWMCFPWQPEIALC